MTKHITVKSKGGTVLAQATESQTQQVEGNYPPAALKEEHFKPSQNNSHTTCSWKGEASYYDLHVDGQVLQDAAWYYPTPKSGKAETLKGFVAFYKNRVDIHA
ncbi:hypothetical protein JCM3766R1_005353 [Sporobolomyces carnicolor]